MFPKITQRSFVSISMITVLACSGVTWMAVNSFHAPTTLAQALEVNLPVSRLGQESFDSLLLRANNLATTTINQRFQQNPALDNIRVVIVGNNQGAIAPLLIVKVSRQNWLSAPRAERWATYFHDSKMLLGFEELTVPRTTPAADMATGETETAEDNGEAEAAAAQEQERARRSEGAILEETPRERERPPAPVPTQRVRSAGQERSPVDPLDIEQLTR